jgi:hypothetical protein
MKKTLVIACKKNPMTNKEVCGADASASFRADLLIQECHQSPV